MERPAQLPCSILDERGNAIVTSPVHTASPNANGSSTADVSKTVLRELDVKIAVAGNYIISFTDAGNGFDEFLLLDCQLINADINAIESIVTAEGDEITGIYSIDGVKRTEMQKGLNIIQFRGGKTKKVICR